MGDSDCRVALRGRVGDRAQDTNGFTRLWLGVWTIASMAVSIALLALATRALPIRTAYALWTGLGAAGTAALGIHLFGEPLTPPRVAGMLLIIAGVAVLRLS